MTEANRVAYGAISASINKITVHWSKELELPVNPLKSAAMHPGYSPTSSYNCDGVNLENREVMRDLGV